MGKNLFAMIEENRSGSVDQYCLIPDPSLGVAVYDILQLREMRREADTKAFLIAALSAIRRERGRCSKEDGMDCVLQFSLPLNTEGGSLLAVGFRDEHLYKAGGVFLRWADENGAQRWDPVDVMRTSSLEPLADEVEASLEMLSGK